MLFSKKNRTARQQLKSLDSVRGLLKKHLEELDNRRSDIPDNIYEATRFILDSSIDAYDSIYSLYAKEHIHSCVILARTVLENAANLKYIHQEDAERRASNFILFPKFVWLKRVERIKNHNDPAKEEYIIKIRKELENYRPTSKRNNNHWDGRTAREVFEEAGLDSLYVEGYARFSGFIHPTYRWEKIDMQQNRPYFNFIRRFILKDNLVAILEALKLVNEKYDLLSGAVIVSDYPEEGADSIFSINNNDLGPVG